MASCAGSSLASSGLRAAPGPSGLMHSLAFPGLHAPPFSSAGGGPFPRVPFPVAGQAVGRGRQGGPQPSRAARAVEAVLAPEAAPSAAAAGAGSSVERLLVPVQRVFAEAEAGGLSGLRDWEAGVSVLAPDGRAGQQRKTKLVCTIGPTSNTREMIWKLAEAGMNVARLNMSHGDHASHLKVIELVREYNRQHAAPGCTQDGPVLAILLDTKGPEVRSGDLPQPIVLEKGDAYTFTIQRGVGNHEAVSVNYDGFIDDVDVGDTVLVDGGLLALLAEAKSASEVQCRVIDGGEFKSRRHLNVRGKSATLPSITEKDWEDIKFGVEHAVDFYALSFVKDAQVVLELKDFLRAEGADIKVVSKIESADSIPNLQSILEASDGAMVARGDLGAELPVEEVPLLQDEIIRICRSMGKPVIVATNMLESMINHPAPTRAEVSDIAIAVREGADAVMLSGETAHGKYPLKAVRVMHTVALETEATMPQPSFRPSAASSLSMASAFQNNMSEMFAFHATMMANTLGASVLVFTRSGFMAALLSHYRPSGSTFAFTNDKRVQQRLALYHGVRALYLPFSSDAEETFTQAISMLLPTSATHELVWMPRLS